jgi:hypothetical protein
MYNVLEIVRQAQDDPVLSDKEKIIHTQGLVSVLKELHDELYAAVLQSYALPADPGKDALLTHLVALNARRLQEKKPASSAGCGQSSKTLPPPIRYKIVSI